MGRCHIVIVVLASTFGACGRSSSQPDPLSAAQLMTDVRALADPRLEGREAATSGEREAATYVTERLRKIGLVPIEQVVPHENGSRNVYVRIEGASADEVIVVGAHLDHLGRRNGELHPGADDNASGVALLVGIAATLARNRDLGRTVLLVWFGAEEVGLIGSQHFVAEPPVPLDKILVMLNIDMIGRPLVDQPLYRLGMAAIGIDPDKSTGLTGARHYPGLRSIADAAFAAYKNDLVAPEDLPDPIGDEVERQSRGRGDSQSFAARGVPALFFGDGESSDYHKPTDTIDKLVPALLEHRARALARIVVELSRAPKSAFARSDLVPPKRQRLLAP